MLKAKPHSSLTCPSFFKQRRDFIADEAVRISLGARGAVVRELHRRLAESGDSGVSTTSERFTNTTAEAVRRFQQNHGLEPDSVCGQATWTALVEAGFRLGDRLLYLRSPYQRGEDVFDLQRQLGSLGFHEGRVDGILGPETSVAIQRFQQNVGLNSDGICGPDTVEVLSRIKPGGSHSMGMLLERERLRAGPSSLSEARLAICGGFWTSLLNATARTLRRRGATVALLTETDGSKLAAGANDFEANVCLSLQLNEDSYSELAYFSTQGFESEGGKHLAELLQSALEKVLDDQEIQIVGMRSPLLRESRMPAVECRLGPRNTAVERQGSIARGISASLSAWMKNPY